MKNTIALLGKIVLCVAILGSVTSAFAGQGITLINTTMANSTQVGPAYTVKGSGVVVPSYGTKVGQFPTTQFPGQVPTVQFPTTQFPGQVPTTQFPGQVPTVQFPTTQFPGQVPTVQTGKPTVVVNNYGTYNNYGNYNNNRGWQDYWDSYDRRQTQQIKDRFNHVKQALRSAGKDYFPLSSQRYAYERQIEYGEQLLKNWSRYRDQNSYYALLSWLNQMEAQIYQNGYVGSYGNYNYGTYANVRVPVMTYVPNYGVQQYATYGNTYYGTGNGYYGPGTGFVDPNVYGPYNLPDYGWNNQGRDIYYGGLNNYPGSPVNSDAFVHGVGIADSIGHIVWGTRNDDGLETAAGALGLAGDILSLFR